MPRSPETTPGRVQGRRPEARDALEVPLGPGRLWVASDSRTPERRAKISAAALAGVASARPLVPLPALPPASPASRCLHNWCREAKESPRHNPPLAPLAVFTPHWLASAAALGKVSEADLHRLARSYLTANHWEGHAHAGRQVSCSVSCSFSVHLPLRCPTAYAPWSCGPYRPGLGQGKLARGGRRGVA